MNKILEKVMNAVIDQGADGDLIFSSSKTLKMSAQKSALDTYNVSSSQILGLRVIKGERVGITYSEALDDESLHLLVKQALENAQATGVSPFERILNLSGDLNDEATYPEDEVELALKTEKAIELEAKVRSLDSRVIAVPYNSYLETEYRSHYLSSKGRSTSYRDQSYSISTSALLEDKGKKATFYDFDMAHTFKELQWNKVIENSFTHAKNLLHEKSLPTGRYNVLFTEDCLKNLVECFSSFYSAKSTMDKINPWAEKLGSNVISKNLTIVDHPTFEKAFRPTRFDSEGVEAQPLTLIKEGCLNSFIHNSMTANHFNTKTTGHAYRSPGGALGVSGTHFVITGKKSSPLPSKYLEVIQMDGLYSGANRVNGDFSVGVKGYSWENGQRVLTFGNVTLSGNLIELLKNVDVVGDKLMSSTDRSFFSVPLMFHGLSIAGA